MSFVSLKNVYKRYKMGEVTITASDGVSFDIEKGEFVVITGASGAGKTTVLNLLGGMDEEMFLSELGLEVSGLDRIIKEGYSLLGLISYLTAGKPEVRAWTITKGTKAPQAAGKIHTDFEKGFIRAEVVSFDDLMSCGSMAAAKEKGLVRSEGKEYVMQDGDIVLFRFNV